MRAVLGRPVRFGALFALTVGMTAISIPIAGYAAPGDVNSINSGRDIGAGTYFNTPGSRTTFINPNGGLWLHSGDLVRGLESSINKVPDGNGGTLYFRAPGNVVRLDGNIDVSAVRNGTLYTGNGGKVFIDSGYLFQNGNIFANGSNGGLVQINVGGMSLGANAQITAQGFGGNGGTVAINSTGAVDIGNGAVIDTSGRVSGTIDTNIINIEGSVVNNQGILRANGAFGTDTKPNDGDSTVMANNPQLAKNPVPPPISAGNGTHDTATMSNVLFEIPPNAAFRGGTIRLVAAGQNQSTTGIINGADTLTSSDKTAINGRIASLVQNNNGDVFNRGSLVADGTLGKNGGTIIIAAARNVINSATIRALGGSGIDGVFSSNGSGAGGGNGGTIVLTAMSAINNTGNIQANGGQGARAQSISVTTGNGKDAVAKITGTAGSGGQGGVLAFSYGTGMNNTGSLQANGGVGGIGGHANSFDTEGATSSNPNPVARATSVGGAGGVGGKGGLIVFSGANNATGGGSVSANGGQGGLGGNAWADAQASSNIGKPSAQSTTTKGAGGAGGTAGTVVAQNPGNFAAGQVFSEKAGGAGNSGSAADRQVATTNGKAVTTTGSSPVVAGSVTAGQNQAILATRRNEYIRHEDAAILLSQNAGAGSNSTTFSGRLGDALIRTVNTPGGSNAGALNDAENANNLIVADTTPQALNTDLTNANINPLFFNLNTLTLLNNGNFSNNMLWTPGVHVIGAGFHDIEFAVGGGHISWLVNGSVTNNQIVITRGLWGGGSTQVAATQDIVNNKDFINIAPFKDLLSGFTVTGPEYESSHAGSLILKGGRDVINSSTGKLESNLIFFDIHPPLNQNPPIDWPRFLNGAQIGATVNLLAGRNLSNAGLVRADALTYRNGANGGANPALAIGGIVIGRHGLGGTTSNTGTISALGNSFFSPNESDGPRFNKNTFPAATSFNGTVDVK